MCQHVTLLGPWPMLSMKIRFSRKKREEAWGVLCSAHRGLITVVVRHEFSSFPSPFLLPSPLQHLRRPPSAGP